MKDAMIVGIGPGELIIVLRQAKRGCRVNMVVEFVKTSGRLIESILIDD